MRWHLTYLFLLAGFFNIQTRVLGQDVNFAREHLKLLCSEKMEGRGYIDKGDLKAARYIRKVYKDLGLKDMGKAYFQEFNVSINRIHAPLVVSIDGQKLMPGYDYTVNCNSPSVHGEFGLARLPDTLSTDSLIADWITKQSGNGKMLVLLETQQSMLPPLHKLSFQGLLVLHNSQPYWHVARCSSVGSVPVIHVNEKVFPGDARFVSLNINSGFQQKYQTQNVLGLLDGSLNDTILISAHYDHLGRMGDVLYPGANDNGSGTAMLLDLARHYASLTIEERPTIIFAAFGAEESGLNGSGYYVQNPLFPLKSIDLVINLDMVGSGSEGITMVNATEYPDVYNKWVKINNEYQLLPELRSRAESCNSDHCPFHQAGVPSIFIYTRGKEYLYYHVPQDKAEKLPFTMYDELFRLIIYSL